MAKRNLFQIIKNWFTGGNKNGGASNRSSTTRKPSNTFVSDRGINSRVEQERQRREQERQAREQERQRKIKEAFAVADEARRRAEAKDESIKHIAQARKGYAEWQKTMKKEFGGTDAKSNRLAQLNSKKYADKAMEHSAKYDPIATSLSEGAISGATLGLYDLIKKNAKKDRREEFDKVQKIAEKSGGEKAVKRAKTVGELAGTMATFGFGTAGARGAVEGSKGVAKATAKLANSEIIKKASARAIEKGLAKGSIEEVSQQLAKKVATELGADITVDNTLGLIDAGARASTAKKGERGKEFLTNVGINALATGTLDLAPTAVRAVKGTKALKSEELLEALEKASKTEAGSKAEKEAVEKAVSELPANTPKVKGEYTQADADELKALTAKKQAIEERKRELRNRINTSTNMQEKETLNREFQKIVHGEEKQVDKAIGKNNAKYEAIVGSTKKVNVEEDIKPIQEGKPLDTPAQKTIENNRALFNSSQETPELPNVKNELPTELPTAKPVEEAIQDSKAELPAVEETANAELPNQNSIYNNGIVDDAVIQARKQINSINGSINITNFGNKAEFQNKNIDEIFGDMGDVLPAVEHEEAGHFGVQHNVSLAEQLKFNEKQAQAQKIADKEGARITDSSKRGYEISKNEEFQNEAVETMDKLGLTPQDFDESALGNLQDKLQGKLYNPKYKKLSYREMCETARKDVWENPKAVMTHLYGLMQGNQRFTPVDLALSAQLVEYGDRYGVKSASDLGHWFMMDYANEMGRISGMYDFIAKQWNLLSGEKKLDYMSKQISKFANDMSLGTVEDIEQAIQTTFAKQATKDGEDIYTSLMKNRGEGNYQFDLDNLGETKPSVLDVLLDNIINSTDKEYVKRAKAELWQTMNSISEPTFLNNLMTWRYFSMLGNPATHARNVAGNAINFGVRSVSDALTVGIEKMLKSMGKIDFQTRAMLTPTEINDIVKGKGVIGSVVDKSLKEDIDGIMKSSQGYKNKVIEEFGTSNRNAVNRGVRKGNDVVGGLLEWEDKGFVSLNYQKSLGQFLKANGYGTGASNPLLKANGGRFANDEAILQAGRNWARQDAMEATFRNFNELSQILNGVTRRGAKRNATSVQKGLAFATNAIIPFTTTPINILMQGVKFSPIGLGNSIVGLMRASSVEEYIKHAEGLGAGLTGTGILALGVWLSSHNSESVSGVRLVSSAGDDERAKALKRAGFQDYSVVWTDGNGHGGSYSLEWCSPVAQTLFTGVEIGNMVKGGLNAGNETTGFDKLGNITTIVSRMVEPTMQMTALQGVNQFIEGTKGATELNGLSSGVLATAQNYMGSLIPTFMGAIARTVAPYDYQLVGTSSSELGNSIEYTVNAQKAKVPFLATKMLAPKVNEKGEITGKKENAGDYAKSALKNLISVGKYQKIDMSQSDVDAFKTYDEAIAEGVDPDTAKNAFAKIDYSTEKKIGKTDKKYGIKKETINLNKWERSTAQQNRSKNGADAMEFLLNSKAWNAQVDRDDRATRRAELIAKNPKSTTDALDILVSTPEYKNASADDKVKMRQAILENATRYSANKESYMGKGHTEADYDYLEKVPARIQAVYNNNTDGIADVLSKEELVHATKAMGKVYDYEDGTRRIGYTKASMLDAFENDPVLSKLSDEAKAQLYNSFKASNAKPYGSSGGRGRRRGSYRRSGGSSKKSSATSTKPLANQSAFKVSVKDSDFKSIAGKKSNRTKLNGSQLGLTEAELQAIIKKANRDNLKTKR